MGCRNLPAPKSENTHALPRGRPCRSPGSWPGSGPAASLQGGEAGAQDVGKARRQHRGRGYGEERPHKLAHQTLGPPRCGATRDAAAQAPGRPIQPSSCVRPRRPKPKQARPTGAPG